MCTIMQPTLSKATRGTTGPKPGQNDAEGEYTIKVYDKQLQLFIANAED